MRPRYGAEVVDAISSKYALWQCLQHARFGREAAFAIEQSRKILP